MIPLILLVLALVLFLLAGFNVGHPRVNLVALGLFFLTAYYLFGVNIR